jgi:hypothetical protein
MDGSDDDLPGAGRGLIVNLARPSHGEPLPLCAYHRIHRSPGTVRRDYYVINNYGLVTGSVGNTRCLELTYLSVISYALQYHLTLTAGWIVPTNLKHWVGESSS